MDLTEFLSGGPMPLKILTIESSLYLPRLRRLYPDSVLFAMTSYEEVIEEYRNLNINWILEKDVKIFTPKTFDIIIAETLPTHTKNSYEDLMAISRALKDTGFFLSTFENIRYAPILQELKEGRFPFRDENLYTKDEVVKMLNDALFKEIFFAPFKVNENFQDMAKDFIKYGFQNFNNDLLTEIWMFKAAVSTSAVLALKELYTPKIRENLAKLLHRIEYDVEREKNLENLWDFIGKEHIFPDYLLGFIEEVSIYKENLLKILLNSAKNRGMEDFLQSASEAVE